MSVCTDQEECPAAMQTSEPLSVAASETDRMHTMDKLRLKLDRIKQSLSKGNIQPNAV